MANDSQCLDYPRKVTWKWKVTKRLNFNRDDKPFHLSNFVRIKIYLLSFFSLNNLVGSFNAL